jgi:methylmalonyl-CoA carboxyltransferase small subunit
LCKLRTIWCQDGKPESFSRKKAGTLKLQITIDGKAYAVDVEVLEENETEELPVYTPQHVKEAASERPPNRGGGAWDADGKVCRSPVMGLAIKVNVTAGQAVEAGEQLLVLEAMKMETYLTAPQAGTVKGVRVAQGDSVKVDQVLVEFE